MDRVCVNQHAAPHQTAGHGPGPVELRHRLYSLVWPRHGGASLGTITISAGVASYPEHGAVPEALLRAADLALYQAKAEGRDQVVKQLKIEDKK